MKKIRMLLFFFIGVFVWGCVNDKEEYDKKPDWLKGSANDLLVSKEQFTMFLQAAEMSGYSSLISGKGLCTVFAPTNEAMSTWLKENNYSSLSDVDEQELKLMVGFHIIEQSWPKEKLLRFQMSQDATQDSKLLGLAFKFKSYAKDKPYIMFDEKTQQNVSIYQREKYLPVFSSQMFKTKEVSDPEAAYKYLFPNVNWKGIDDKLYLGNASVIEYELPTDNGYVYTIDRVVDLPQTLYNALETAQGGEYSIFRELFDRFRNITYDQTITNNFAPPGEKYYLFYHNSKPINAIDLPELASEWSYHGEDDNARETYFRYLSESYNCFAFTNQAIEQYVSEFFPGFGNYAEIPQMSLYYLLKSHADDHQKIKFVDELLTRGVDGQLGENWSLASENLKYREYCSNGVIYGVDKIFSPLVFDIITKPLFQEQKYSIMANMFHSTNEFLTLVTQEPDYYTLFIQNDNLFERREIRVNYKDPQFGDEIIESRKPDGTFGTFPNLAEHVQRHVIYGAIRDFVTPQYYASKLAFNYIFVKDNIVYSESNELTLTSDGYETLNGVTYELDDMIEPTTITLEKAISEDGRYAVFFKKLQDAGLMTLTNSVWTMPFLRGDRYMVFIPEDLSNAPSNKTELAAYLKYCFVSTSTNLLSDYVLPNFGNEPTGKLDTMMEDPALSTSVHKVYKKISLHFNDAESLALTNDSGVKSVTNGERAHFLTNGVIFSVKGQLELGN